MNPLTTEWVDKAEGDFVTARRELAARKTPNYDAVCFHSQQCAEKYLKALLQERESTIPRIHSLLELAKLGAIDEVSAPAVSDALLTLEGYATVYRYPGFSANKQDARAALAAAKVVRSIIRLRLNLA